MKRPLHKLRVAGIAILLSCLCLASSAYALGLGSLKVDSFLNEPLSGKIEIVSVDGDDLGSVKASIADKDAFARLGVEYPDYIEELSLSTSIENQKTFLLISSENAIKEPFIHFIIEVQWSGGRFLREYTALIDPPVYAKSAPKALVEPKVIGEDSVYQSAEIQKETLVLADPDPVEPIYQQAEEQPAETEIEADGGDAGIVETGETDAKYGPVTSGESLGMIAEGLQQEFPDLSIFQIMTVLFNENRDAFINDNINGLKKGSVLNISSIGKIREVDIQEGKNLFYEHLANWEPPLPNDGGFESEGSGIKVAGDTYEYSDDSLELENTSSDYSEPQTNTDEDFRVGASSNFGSSTSADIGSNEGKVAALRSEISELEVSLQSSQLENQELKERISILEGQINDLNRLVSLDVEDSDLAQVQSALADQLDREESLALVGADTGISQELTEDGADSDVPSDDSAVVSGAESDGENDTVGGFAGAEGAGLSESSVQGVDAEVMSEKSTVSSLSATTGESTSDSSAEASVAKSPVSSFQKEESFMSSIISTVTGLGSSVIAAIGAILLLILGLIWYRRKQADEEFEVSMLSIDSYTNQSSESFESVVESAQKLDEHPVNAITSTEVAETIDLESQSAQSIDLPTQESEISVTQTKETSFLTVYSDSDAVVQADEVDPVAEADVYIAYGRFEQAEDVLKAGIEAEPDRFDLKAKLLSMYQRTNKIDPFTRMAEDVFAQNSNLNGEQWAQICAMGKEIDAQNPLFETELDGSKTSEPDSSETVALDVSEASIELEDGSSVEFEVSDVDATTISLDTDSLDGESLEITADSEDDAVLADVIDFESTSINLDDEPPVDLSDGVDLSLMSDEGKPETTENSISETIDLESQLSDEADSVSVDIDSSADETDVAEVSEDSRSDFLQEVSDIEIEDDYNEGKTQYDLAKVFIDLGDKEGARKILKDIIDNESNESSIISEAVTLYKELDS